MGEDTPEMVVLGSIINQNEQAMGNKSVNSTPLWPLHLFLLLCSYLFSSRPWLPSEDCNSGYLSEINLFLYELILVLVFHHGKSNPK